MELFQDGGKVDKASGNEIPLGSTAAEVRDDQPAMLSEGEMVIPADVVRYFGVEHFMNLRDQAKMGYKKMEAMGQFGTEEGQTLPDDTIFNAGGPPFTIEDIEVIEDEEEPVEAAAGALITDTVPLVTSAVGTANTLLNNTDSSGDGTNVTEDDLTSTGQQTAFTQQGAQDLIGTNSFEYLKSLMPQAVLDTATDTEVAAAENYTNNIDTNVTGTPSAASDAGGEGPVGTAQPSGGGSSSVISSQPGTGDIQTLMSYPTAANVQGLKNFGELKDTDAGKAFLSLMGGVVSAGMNPGQYAPVVGLVQRGVSMLEPALFGTNNIGKGFAELRDIPLMQANMASRAVRSFEYDMANLTPEQKSTLNTVIEAMEIGEINDIDITAPGVTVGKTDRGETVVKGAGKFAAAYNRAGEIVGDKIVSPVDPKDVKEGTKTAGKVVNNMNFAADPNTNPSREDPGVTQGFGGGPLSASEAFGITNPAISLGENFGVPDDDDIEEDNKPDYGGFTGAESVLGDTNQSNINSNLEAFDYGNDGATGNTDNVGSMEEGFDVADAMGGNAGGNDGTADSSGSDGISDTEGSGFKHGGFVKKRKYKKKKTRRGLAGR